MRKTKKAVKAAPKKTETRGRKSKEIIAKILEDYAASVSPAKICKRYKISPRTLMRYTKLPTTHPSNDLKPMPEAIRPETPYKTWMNQMIESSTKKMNEDLEKLFTGYKPERNSSIRVEKCTTCNNLVKVSTNVDGTNFYLPTVENMTTLHDSPHTCYVCGSKMADPLANIMQEDMSIGRRSYFDGLLKKTLGDVKRSEDVTVKTSQFDPVNKPSHYADSKIEVIDYIEDKKLNYNLGNAVKYISRAGKKTPDPLQDLRKAKWYLDREIANLSKAQS